MINRESIFTLQIIVIISCMLGMGTFIILCKLINLYPDFMIPFSLVMNIFSFIVVSIKSNLFHENFSFLQLPFAILFVFLFSLLWPFAAPFIIGFHLSLFEEKI